MSTAASIAVLIISAISTNAIESKRTISSILDTSTASAATSTATAIRKWMRMFRCVRSTWMIPSKATLKLSMIDGGRRPGIGLIVPRPGSRARGAPSRRHARSRAGGGSRARAATATRHRRPGGRRRRRRAPAARRPATRRGRRSGTTGRRLPRRCPRCSAFSARISSGATKAIPSSASPIPSLASACSASATAPAASTSMPLRLSTSISITSCGRCRSLRRTACTPRRSAARACAGRHPRVRTRRRRCRRRRGGCRVPGSDRMPVRAGGRSG